MKIAFIVEKFPVVSETFIIDQVVGLLKRGIEVEIFSIQKGDFKNISDSFNQYNLGKHVHYLGVPKNKFFRYVKVVPIFIHVLFFQPKLIFRVLDIKKYGRDATSLRLLYWANLWRKNKFDLVHCHKGSTGNKFLIIRDALMIHTKFITTFYGSDVSRDFNSYGFNLYDRLKEESSLFFVMSENMKQRLLIHGFDQSKVVVHPVGINVKDYKYQGRIFKKDELVQIISVGRFEEKKGFDDLLRALAIVKEKFVTNFHCTIVGDGKLKNELHSLTKSLGLEGSVTYTGYMKIEEIINLFSKMHFFVQPSKTAKDGNME